MKAVERERMRRDIAEAFEFARFLIKNPRMLKKIKDGAEIHIIPAGAWRGRRSPKARGKVQFFSAETVFRDL